VIIRKSFPQIYKLTHPKSGGAYFLVSARSKKWGLRTRKTFPTEREAVDYARQIEKQIKSFGAQPNVPKEKLVLADAYQALADRLKPFGKKPEDAVDQYVKFLGDEASRQAKPPIRDLVDGWQAFKLTDTTLSRPMVRDIRSYARFLKSKWGDMKPDEPKKNEIDVVIRGLKVSNNTRRKYLRFVRMFFSWVRDEGHILVNPTDGIYFKPDAFSGEHYSVGDTKRLLRYVADNEQDLIGYYALLTFAGLRPTEGARVQWKDFSFKTRELYVRKGKTQARHVMLEPVAVEWMKWHRDRSAADAPFVQLKALPNREKRIREAVFKGDWIQDGLRHGFATYFKNLKKDIALVSDYMGNSPDVVKRHYARTIPAEEYQAFWGLTPGVVMADEIAPHEPKRSGDAAGGSVHEGGRASD
jgi:integrase